MMIGSNTVIVMIMMIMMMIMILLINYTNIINMDRNNMRIITLYGNDNDDDD